MFRCQSGECIQQIYVCDDITDCYDSSDEVGCPMTSGGKTIKPFFQPSCFNYTVPRVKPNHCHLKISVTWNIFDKVAFKVYILVYTFLTVKQILLLFTFCNTKQLPNEKFIKTDYIGTKCSKWAWLCFTFVQRYLVLIRIFKCWKWKKILFFTKLPLTRLFVCLRIVFARSVSTWHSTRLLRWKSAMRNTWPMYISFTNVWLHTSLWRRIWWTELR